MKKLKITKENLATVFGAVKNWFKNNSYSVEYQYYPENRKAYTTLGEEFYANEPLSPIRQSVNAGYKSPEILMGYFPTLGGEELGGIVIDSHMINYGRTPSVIALGSRISISPTQIKVYYTFGCVTDKLRTVLVYNTSDYETVEQMVRYEVDMSDQYDDFEDWEEDYEDFIDDDLFEKIHEEAEYKGTRQDAINEALSE